MCLFFFLTFLKTGCFGINSVFIVFVVKHCFYLFYYYYYSFDSLKEEESRERREKKKECFLYRESKKKKKRCSISDGRLYVDDKKTLQDQLQELMGCSCHAQVPALAHNLSWVRLIPSSITFFSPFYRFSLPYFLPFLHLLFFFFIPDLNTVPRLFTQFL